MLFRAILAAFIVCFGVAHFFSAPAHAAPPGYQHTIDPKIRIWQSSARYRHALGEKEPRAETAAPILIRFAAKPSAVLLAKLERTGVRFSRGKHQRRRSLGLFYPARASRAGIEMLKKSPLVARVDLDGHLGMRRPLTMSGNVTRAIASWTARPRGATGKGVLIGSLDSGIDVYHPGFFRPDGALYRWIDNNKNGVFDPGSDSVDLNGDGQASAGELLRHWDTRYYDVYMQSVILGSGKLGFDAGRDFLYVDANGNGQRDQGPSPPYGDAAPTFGELVLVADDVNGNGKLDPEEKLRALGTSKVNAAKIEGKVYQRGSNLSSAPNLQGGRHGTATSGIMVAGPRGYHEQVGLAPDADLVLVEHGKTELADEIVWLVRDMSVDLVLHEYSVWSGYHLDGSSNVEQLIDQAHQQGVPQIVPAGNLNGAPDKHAAFSLAPSAQKNLGINVPAPAAGYSSNTPVVMTFIWRNPSQTPTISLAGPAGASVTLEDNNTGGKSWGNGELTWYSYRDDSSRGTAMVLVYLMPGSQSSVTKGVWTATIQNNSAQKLDMYTYVSDQASHWGAGVGFRSDTTSAMTTCWPSTADSAISVAAFTGHEGPPYDSKREPVGALRAYSGRGPRVDGVPTIDIAAPDNPITTINRLDQRGQPWIGWASYGVFGGTSGAGPHVAAAVAMLLEVEPGLTADQVKTRLKSRAMVDAQVTPGDGWGAGKLRIDRLLFANFFADNGAPSLSLLSTNEAKAGAPFTIKVIAADAEDNPSQLQIRWDRDYDGTYDGDFAALSDLTLTPSTPGFVHAKAQIRDSAGATAEAIVLVKVTLAGPADSGPAPDKAAPQSDTGVADGTIPIAPKTPKTNGCSLASAGDRDRDSSLSSETGGSRLGAVWIGLLMLLLIGRNRSRRAGSSRRREHLATIRWL
jgi:subtilisin family serine protease